MEFDREVKVMKPVVCQSSHSLRRGNRSRSSGEPAERSFEEGRLFGHLTVSAGLSESECGVS